MQFAAIVDFWKDGLGFSSPGKSGAFLAMMMIAVWGFAYFRVLGFYISSILFAIFGVALLETSSRGGVLAVFVGAIPLLIFAPRPWDGRKIAILIASIWAILLCSASLESNKLFRLDSRWNEPSLPDRIEFWKAALPMVADAPGGWGGGNSGSAYAQWYQPLDRRETYRTLVSTHLTWIAERGWVSGALYIATCVLALVIAWPNRRTPWTAIPFGVLLAFGVAAQFTSVAESAVLWFFPLGAVGLTLIWRACNGVLPTKKAWSVAAVATVGMIGLFFLIPSGSFHKVGSAITWKSQKPDTWVIVDTDVFGAEFGRSFRRDAYDYVSSPVGFAKSLSDVPATAKHIVLPGGTCKDLSSATMSRFSKTTEFTLVNPFFPPTSDTANALRERAVQVVFGEYAERAASSAWQGIGRYRQLTGAGDFIPSWPTALNSSLMR